MVALPLNPAAPPEPIAGRIPGRPGPNSAHPELVEGWIPSRPGYHSAHPELVEGRASRRSWLPLPAAILVLLLLLAALAPACAPSDSKNPAAALTLEQAVGQMLLVGFRGTEVDEPTAQMLRDIQPGGVILFDRDGPSGGELPRNIADRNQLQALTAQLQEQAEIPYFIAIDAEGGYVNRLKEKYGFALKVPTAEKLGLRPVSETAAIAGQLADEMREMGLNWNLAPVVDVNVNPESTAIGAIERSFSADPSVVADQAQAFSAAMRQRQVIPTLKHFPGHGSAAGDTHLGVTDVTATYRRDLELAPYRELIDGGYADALMTAHIVNRNLDAAARPATLSPAIIDGLLRQELGFAGVVVSDDMQMGAIVAQYGPGEAAIAAAQAGVDVILLANQQGDYDLQRVYGVRDALLQAVAAGVIAEERIYWSAERILALKERYGIR